jgi:L-xylulokinase
MPHFLGIDIGGSVIKSGLYDETGREKGVVSLDDAVVARHLGWAERDMNAMWRLVVATIREVVAKTGVAADDIAGICFSAHGKGLYLVDANGNPLGNGIVSSDNRAMPQVRALKAAGTQDRIYPKSYQQIWPSHPAAILRWMKENQPDTYGRIGHVLMAHDWIRFKMTGCLGSEVTNISGSNLFNVDSGAFDTELLRQFGIEEMAGCLPDVVGSIESPAGLNSAAAAETGLKIGTPVYGGVFDVLSAAVCSGLVDESRICITMGTWTIVTWTTDHIPHNDYPYTWGRYCIPDRYFVHEGSPTSAANLEWFVRTFMAGRERPYADCDALLAGLEPAGTRIQFLPYLFSSNLGDNLTAGFYGLANADGFGEVVQSVFEGICFAQQVHLDRILALAGPGRQLRLTGGPTRSRPWVQMVADIAGAPMEVVHVEQSGCLGAAIAASVGSGVHASFVDAMNVMCPPASLVEPDLRRTDRYRDKYQRFLQLARTLDTLPPVA